MTLRPSQVPIQHVSACEHGAGRIASRASASPELHAQPASQPQAVSTAPAVAVRPLNRPGQPLDSTVQERMEPRFGRGLASVRIHADADAADAADALDARAYTLGDHIVFGAGQYAPAAAAGERLLAHELAHVVQQTAPDAQLARRSPVTPQQAQAEAVRAADAMVTGRPMPSLSRASGPALQSRTPDAEKTAPPHVKDASGASAKAARHDSIVVWFDRDSDALRRDRATGQLVADTIAAVRAHLARHKDARIVIAGYASAEGDAEHNRLLSERRAWTVKGILEAAGVPEEQLLDVGHGADSTWPSLALNRRVEIEVPVDTEAQPVSPRDKRPITDDEKTLLGRLDRLAEFVGSATPEALEFALAVRAFEATLRRRIEAVEAGRNLPEEVRITLEALSLWAQDTGRTWGHAAGNYNINLSAPQYATVAGYMDKCNIYVAEVLNRTVGTLQQIYESDRQPGRYFPYRAKDWGDTGKTIPEYPVTRAPRMGDIWSNGHHVGIYLGSYNGHRMYISARNDTDDVFGLGDVQFEHGIQIKFLPDGGVMRRHVKQAPQVK